MTNAAEPRKRQVAEAAAALVEDGMLLGLGSGSTAAEFVVALARRVAAGELSGPVSGVPTSLATQRLAERHGFRLVDLPADGVDLAIDGMDEVTFDLDAIKGLGGALLREKIVAAAAGRFVLIGDDGKVVDFLGQRAPVPVEVARFGWRRTLESLKDLGAAATLRRQEGEAFLSDNGNHVVDCRFSAPFDAAATARRLSEVPGVLGHGLFLGLASEALIASADGVVRLAGGPGTSSAAGLAPGAAS